MPVRRHLAWIMADVSLEELKQRLRAQKPTVAITLAEQRSALEASSARARSDPRVLVERTRAGNCLAEWLKPQDARPGAVLLYLHGGAFVGGSCASHRPLATQLALATGRDTLTLDYRLAPEHPWPAAEHDAFEAYVELLHDAQDIVVAGDSAGGNIAMQLLLRVRDAGLRPPGAAVLMSPWIDLDVSSPAAEVLARQDPTLDVDRLRRYAAMYRGTLAGPDILHACLEGLPRILTQAGSAEILHDDAVCLHDALVRAGVASRLDVCPGAFHVWHAYFPWLCEARHAIAEIGQFVNA